MCTARVVEGSTCAYPGICEWNTVKNRSSTLHVVIARASATTSDKDWVEYDGPAHDAWSELHSMDLIYERLNSEDVRYIWKSVLISRLCDVFFWQSIDPIKDIAYDLTPIALKNNWTTRFQPRLLRQMISDGKFMAAPDRYKFWGIWYSKSTFRRFGFQPPRTWPELIHICDVLLANGTVPFGLGSKDNFQGMTWFANIALYRGGATWFNTMTAGGINFATDPIHRKVWEYVDSIRKYFPQPLSVTADMGIQEVAYKWVRQEYAMILFSSTAAFMPSMVFQRRLRLLPISSYQRIDSGERHGSIHKLLHGRGEQECETVDQGVEVR